MTGTTPDTHLAALDQTEAGLSGGVTGLTPGAALGLIDHWRTACASATDADLGAVSAGLGRLSDLLRADRLDGRAIGETLLQLADDTSAAATAAPDERMTPRLERIGTLLASAARALQS